MQWLCWQLGWFRHFELWGEGRGSLRRGRGPEALRLGTPWIHAAFAACASRFGYHVQQRFYSLNPSTLPILISVYRAEIGSIVENNGKSFGFFKTWAVTRRTAEYPASSVVFCAYALNRGPAGAPPAAAFALISMILGRGVLLKEETPTSPRASQEIDAYSQRRNPGYGRCASQDGS
jgi:hypothetical protein